MQEANRDSIPSWVEVIVDCPGAKGLYTYALPEGLTVNPGDIVGLSFGHRQVSAIVVRLTKYLPKGVQLSSLRYVESVINSTFFSKEYWVLLNRVARYYQTSLMRVARTALPPGLLSKSQRRIRLNKDISIQTIEQVLNQSSASQLVHQLLSVLRSSPQGDYSWQYLRQQLRGWPKPPQESSLESSKSSKSSDALNLAKALRQLTQLGVVESYLAPPRRLRVQKRQAVLLLRTVRSTGPSRQRSLTNDSAAEDDDTDLSKRQAAIVIALEKHGGELWLSDALQRLHTTSKTLQKIAAQGYLTIELREKLRVGSHSTALPDRPKALTTDQARALATLYAMNGYCEALLHGVTGSGKTEVYLQAIAPILAAQKSALVLVPEIGLTPQLTDRFRSRFGDRVCVYHSGLSEGERYDTWRQMFTGTPQVIIGTRSAVFAPLPHLGMIILDEEHDDSFKQHQPMPCYHARQVARWRAELENCPLILGSATPSIETWVRFKSMDSPTLCQPEGLTPGGPAPSVLLHYLRLPQRVHARPLPPIEVVDMREELHQGNRTIFSRPLQLAIENLIAQGNQGILFIHRRGHSSFVSCRSCGHVMECPHCDVSLAFHQVHRTAKASLRCHYCGYSQVHPSKCPECYSPYLKNFGSGTQRVVNDLAKYLPQARCLRFDSDTTRNKGAHRALLARFAQGEADLLVGTQMLTKGIDLPQVTLVGVIAADGLLFMPDYRASERAFQTMVQVAGRAGRGEQPGRVIVQTYSPKHVAIEALRPHAAPSAELSKAVEGQPAPDSQADSQASYTAFLTAELSDRADLNYPPYGRLVLLRISGLDETATEKAAQRIVTALTHQLGDHDSGLAEGDQPVAPYEIMGPVPAPVFRVACRYRWQILIKLTVDAHLPDLSGLQRQTPKGVKLTIDVDPLNLS